MTEDRICENCAYCVIENREDMKGFRYNSYMCCKFPSFHREEKRFNYCDDFKSYSSEVMQKIERTLSASK